MPDAWTLVRRLRGSLSSPALEARMEAELQLHLDLETEMLIARGLDPREARVIARQRFGSVARVEDECRESRMALGARRANVVRMIVRQTAAPLVFGLGVGLIVAPLMTRAGAGLLFAIEPSDPSTYIAVVATLALTGAVACLVPACRAAAIDPMRALRAA